MPNTTRRGPGGIILSLDTQEIVRDNPGDGTPAMLYLPDGRSGTYWCALDTGEVDSQPITPAQQQWVDSLADMVDGWLDANS